MGVRCIHLAQSHRSSVAGAQQIGQLYVQVLEAQMLPACAPFYMGLAAGWGVLVSKYVEHSGAPWCLRHAASFLQRSGRSDHGSQ